MRKVVGISQKIKRAWLDAELDRIVQTTDQAELRTFLDQYLKEELPGSESRAKAAGIILRIWSGVPVDRVGLRDRAIAMLPSISGQERIWLHWGMTALAYPFFRDIAEVIGRLLALQDDFTTAQVQGRMLTAWGDRNTSTEAAQKLITSLVDWEVLRSTKTKGHFFLARRMTASISDLQLWLLEALLTSSAADEIEAQQLLKLPELFPFTLSVGVADLRRHERFNIHRQGLDMEMVSLRELKLERQSKRTKKPKTRSVKSGHTNVFGEQADRGNGDSIEKVSVKAFPERGDHLLQVRDTCVPDYPFSAPSGECVQQFREGYYFGCIALAQAVVEAAIRHVWRVKLNKWHIGEATFGEILGALHKKKLISDDWKGRLDAMYADRHSLHRLQLSEESDQRQLAERAREMLRLLNDLELEFFKFSASGGIAVPNYLGSSVLQL